MANLITTPILAPPDTIDVLVDFYDDEERRAFLSSHANESLTQLPMRVSVPTSDFCAYYLYYKRRPGVKGFSTHGDIAQRWADALVELDGLVSFSGGSIRLAADGPLDSGTTERLGEALGLCVASQLHGLHQADWRRIPVTPTRPTLDFWNPLSASDGKEFVQLETKGTTTDDNSLKSSSTAKHKADIKRKKAAATDEQRASSILYGTIASFDAQPGAVARCWLVDPPAGFRGNVEAFRIVARLRYIGDLVSFLSPRSNLAASLQTRLAALQQLEAIEDLNGVPLRNAKGADYESYIGWGSERRHAWFASKSVVTDGPAGGAVFVGNPRHLLLIAIREELVLMAARQDFGTLGSYSFPAATIEKVVDCIVSRGQFDRSFARVMALPRDISRSGQYIRFRLSGNLHYTQSGLVLGVLPIPEEWWL